MSKKSNYTYNDNKPSRSVRYGQSTEMRNKALFRTLLIVSYEIRQIEEGEEELLEALNHLKKELNRRLNRKP